MSDALDSEKFGEVVAEAMIKSHDFDEVASELADRIFDEEIFNAASRLRVKAEEMLGIQFVEDEKHFEFGQTFEGDIRRALVKAIALKMKEF